MTITKEYLKELRELYFDVAFDSDKTELRKFLAKFEMEECSELFKTSENLPEQLSCLMTDVSSAFEAQGFIKGFIYAKEIMK